MKKVFLLIIVIILFLVGQYKLEAILCSDIIKEAIEVYAYETSEIDENGDVIIDLVIEGITENNYVLVQNDYNNEVRTYYYSDTNEGVVTIHSPNIYRKINYTIKVYLTDSSCNSDIVRTLDVTTNMFNKISGYNVCDTEFYVEKCDPFYDIENINEDDFIKEIEKEIEELSKTTLDKVALFVKNYYLFVLIPIVLIIVIYTIRIIALKRGRKNE